MKAKQCKECGRIFTPRSGTQRYCDGPHQTECKCCGRLFDYTCSPNERPKYCIREELKLYKASYSRVDIDYSLHEI